MRFKLDENLGRRGLGAFEAEGHDVSTIHLQGLDGSPDALVYDVCRVEGRVLVTLDLDFSNPLVRPEDDFRRRSPSAVKKPGAVRVGRRGGAAVGRFEREHDRWVAVDRSSDAHSSLVAARGRAMTRRREVQELPR